MRSLPWWVAAAILVGLIAWRAHVRRNQPGPEPVGGPDAPLAPPSPPPSCLAGDETPTQRGVHEATLRTFGPKGQSPLTHVEAGPSGTVLVRAWLEGVEGSSRALVVDAQGCTYGRRGDRDLAELARDLGWRRIPPPAEELARVAVFGFVDGEWPEHNATIEMQGPDMTVILTSKGKGTRVARVLFPAAEGATWKER